MLGRQTWQCIEMGPKEMDAGNMELKPKHAFVLFYSPG